MHKLSVRAESGRSCRRQERNDPFAAQERIARRSDWVLAAINLLVLQFVLMVALEMAWPRAYPGTRPPGHAYGIVLLVSTANALQAVRLRRKRRRRKLLRRQEDRLALGLCPRCEYNLTGNTTGVCPECGGRTSSSLCDHIAGGET